MADHGRRYQADSLPRPYLKGLPKGGSADSVPSTRQPSLSLARQHAFHFVRRRRDQPISPAERPLPTLVAPRVDTVRLSLKITVIKRIAHAARALLSALCHVRRSTPQDSRGRCRQVPRSLECRREVTKG